MNFFLAERSEGSWVIALIFGAIWLIFSIVSAITKKQEEAKRRQLRQQLEAGVARTAGDPELFQPKVTRRTGAQVQNAARIQPMRALQPTQQQQRQKQQQPKRAAPAPVMKRAPAARETPRTPPRAAPPPIPGKKEAVQSIVSSLPGNRQDIAATEISKMDEAKKTKQASVNADSLNKWLRPATLRQQFMLTEVLQPPLALRPDRD